MEANTAMIARQAHPKSRELGARSWEFRKDAKS